MDKLTGIIPALPAPIDEQGKVKHEVYRRHIGDCIRAGVHGFWVCGTTGCSVYLNVEQRTELMRAAVEEVAGRVPVIAHVGAMSTRDAVTLAKTAAELGVDVLAAMPPLLYPVTQRTIIEYLTCIAEQGQLPLAYYYLPGYTKVQLDAGQLCEIFEQVPNVVAMKYGEQDLYKVAEIRRRLPNVAIFGAFEDFLLAGLVVDCYDGAIGAGLNLLPGPFVDLYNAFKSGKIETAQSIHRAIESAMALPGEFDFIATSYAVLNLLGYDCGRPCPPMIHLDSDEIERVKSFMLKGLRPEPFEQARLIETRDLLGVE